MRGCCCCVSGVCWWPARRCGGWLLGWWFVALLKPGRVVGCCWHGGIETNVCTLTPPNSTLTLLTAVTLCGPSPTTPPHTKQHKKLQVGVAARRESLGATLAGLQEMLMYGLKGMAAYTHHAGMLFFHVVLYVILPCRLLLVAALAAAGQRVCRQRQLLYSSRAAGLKISHSTVTRTTTHSRLPFPL